MFLKIHQGRREVIALCDEELLGKRFEEGKMQLEIKENFFKGESISEENALEFLKRKSLEYATFNIVGEKSVGVALSSGIAEEGNIGHVQNIKFALVF